MALEKAPTPDGFENFIFKLISPQKLESLEPVLRRIGEEYPYWDKVKYWKMPEGIEPAAIWTIAKIRRRASPFEIIIGKHRFYWNITGEMQQALHEGDMNLGGTLRSDGLIPVENRPAYLVSSLMEEAIASSQIEGAVTTRKAAKEMLRMGRAPRNRSEQMVLNNYRTIRHISLIKNAPLTPEVLLDLQRLMTEDTLDDPEDAGRFRAKEDKIIVSDHRTQEVAYTPPAAAELPELLAALCDFFNTASHPVFIHPLVKASILHFLVGYIHPFPDGNGRTARALFYWYLLRQGYWLAEFLSISRMILRSKDAYAKAYLYTETDDNDLTYFIRYQLQLMGTAYDDLKKFIAHKQAERRALSRLRDTAGLNARQTELLRSMLDEPDRIVTVVEAQRRLAVSNQTARTDLQKLVTAGFLVPVAIDGKTQGFRAGASFLNPD